MKNYGNRDVLHVVLYAFWWYELFFKWTSLKAAFFNNTIVLWTFEGWHKCYFARMSADIIHHDRCVSVWPRANKISKVKTFQGRPVYYTASQDCYRNARLYNINNWGWASFTAIYYYNKCIYWRTVSALAINFVQK